jgi:hypothetical protein
MRTAAFDGLLDPLASSSGRPALRQITEFRISPEVQARGGYFAERANNGELTPEEDEAHLPTSRRCNAPSSETKNPSPNRFTSQTVNDDEAPRTNWKEVLPSPCHPARSDSREHSLEIT